MGPPTEPEQTVSAFAAGLSALRRFWRPFVLIQGAALALGLAYRLSGTVRAGCVVLATWKTTGGVPFAALTGAVAGGLLPELAKRLVDRKRAHRTDHLGDVLFNTAFFAVNGVVVDALYRMEARLFGDDARAATVIAKVAFDQLVFTPLWQVVIVTLFLWRRRGYSWTATRPALRAGFLRTHVLPLLVPCWWFWLPIVSIVYALPGPLQFLMFSFALAAWSLILVFIAAGAGAGQSGDDDQEAQ
jgi:hypothetical protein